MMRNPVYWKASSQNALSRIAQLRMSPTLSSISPLDDSIVWSGSPATDAQIASVMQSATDSLEHWRNASLDERISVVTRYAEHLRQNQQEIADLIVREVGKLPWDAQGEVKAAIAKVELSIQAIQQRRDTLRIGDGDLQRVIRFRPLGVVLVLGPFNFPLHLPGGQIIPALLSGNTVVFKPSEQAMAVGQWITEAWQRSGLPSDCLQMIAGGAETAVTAIDSPSVRGVFLTGSRVAGRAIHRQLAGRPEVLLALELGGNNPMVVTDTEPEIAASVVSFSAFISSGQRCTCARRAIFVESPQTDAQLDALVHRTAELRVGMPADQPVPEVGPLISSGAANHLLDTYQQLLHLGCKIVLPLSISTRRSNLVPPAIVDASELSDAALRELGTMEWFGPLLVIQRVADFEIALSAAAKTSYGLAASLLGGTEAMFDQFVSRVGAGVVNWNRPTTGAAGTLPFGGLGDSGNHRPAGFFAIDFCNDPIASLESTLPLAEDAWDVAN